MLDLIGDASGYLSAPAGRSRWQDTWTMKRTRREAMAALARTYASWLRTGCGALATVAGLAGAFLLGRGMNDLSADGGLLAVLTMLAGVVLLLGGLAAGGYVLFTGTRLVGALRTWSAARAGDGGPGVGVVLTPAVVVRLVLALLVLVAGIAVVLVRTGVLSLDLGVLVSGAEADSGQRLRQWFAAVIGILAGLAAGSGALRAGRAVRRRPGKPTPSAAGGQYAPPQGQSGPAGPAGAAGAGYGPGAGFAPETGDTWQSADTWQPGRVPQPGPGVPLDSSQVPQPDGGYAAEVGSAGGYGPGGAGGSQAGYVPQQDAEPSPGYVLPAELAPEPGYGAAAEAADAGGPSPYAPQTGYGAPGPYAPQAPPSPEAPGADPAPEAAPIPDEWAATRMVGDLSVPASRPGSLRAVLPDGRAIAADGLTLLGRSPAGRAGEEHAEPVAIADSSVSKTHLALRLDGGRAWATDRASTNGTILVRAGAQETLEPWDEVPLAAGDRLLLGTSSVQIEAAGPS